MSKRETKPTTVDPEFFDSTMAEISLFISKFEEKNLHGVMMWAMTLYLVARYRDDPEGLDGAKRELLGLSTNTFDNLVEEFENESIHVRRELIS